MMKFNSTIHGAVLVALLLVVPGVVFAQALTGFPTTVTEFTGTSTQSLPEALRLVVNALLIILGIIAAIFIVIGGVRYLTAGGDEDQVETAKRTILYAAIGLAIIFLASAAVKFVLSALESAR